MKYILLLGILFAACHKSSEPNCVTWHVMYWQGKSDQTTVTTNYYPFNQDKEICGAGKDTVFRNKTIIIRQVSSNLFDYETFQSPK